MSIEIESGQNAYLMRGGPYELALLTHRKSGFLARDYTFHEYPKMLRISRGVEEVQRQTETCKGATISWSEKKEMFDEIVVHSEAEEERVLGGGRTSAQLEEERLGLLTKARGLGIPADPTWTSVRLRRELGEKLDEPAPADEMGALEAKLAQLQRMAQMRQQIADLEAQLAGRPSDDADDLRAQLVELGMTPDKRWGAARLREELERATAPHAQAA